jgi:ligand-binding sensor domain-containing protein
MKYGHGYALLLGFVFYTSCGQSQSNTSQDNTTRDSLRKENSAGKLAVSLAETHNMPVSMVRHVKQARNGDILVASFLGVFRYDGASFTNLTSVIVPPRYSSFWDVLEDRKGNLWFGSGDSGVYRYDGKSFAHFTTKDGLASNTALSFYEDRAGTIWIGSTLYDGKSFRNLSVTDGFPSNNIRLLLEDKTGKQWFGAQGESMFVFDGKTFTVLKNTDGKTFNNVWSVIEDTKGYIWFGDREGLWRYDGSVFTKVSQRGAYAIIQDKKGNIWTSGVVRPNTWALSRYDAKTLYDKAAHVTEIKSGGMMAFLDLLEAGDGSIWYGSASGVYRYDGKRVTDFRPKEIQD